MTTGLDGKEILTGYPFTVSTITWTRQADDPTVYTGAVAKVEFYDKIATPDPILSLSSDSGSAFTTKTDSAEVVAFSLTLSVAHLTTLLNDQMSNVIRYRFVLITTAGAVANPPEGSGYDGNITVKRPSYWH